MTRVDQRGRATIRLPRMFYDDHWSRDLPTPEAVHENTRSVWVWVDDPDLPELLNDARHYADPVGFDPDIQRTICRAASRLLEAHRRQTQTQALEDPAPDQEDPDADAMARLERELNRG